MEDNNYNHDNFVRLGWTPKQSLFIKSTANVAALGGFVLGYYLLNKYNPENAINENQASNLIISSLIGGLAWFTGLFTGTGLARRYEHYKNRKNNSPNNSDITSLL